MALEEHVWRFLASCVVMIPMERAGLLPCAFRYCQTLAPHQCPKGDVVSSCRPSLWASIRLLVRKRQVVTPCSHEQ